MNPNERRRPCVAVFDEPQGSRPDVITALVKAQDWPAATHDSHPVRAIYQGDKLAACIRGSGGALCWVRSRAGSTPWLRRAPRATSAFEPSELISGRYPS